MKQELSGVWIGLFVAIGLAMSGYFISQTLYNSQVALNTAQAKGLAERRVKADRANWEIEFNLATGSRSGVSGLYQTLKSHQAKIITSLNDRGFTTDEIKVGAFDYSYREYRDEDQKLVDRKYILEGSLEVETAKVDKVSAARNALGELLAEGINIDSGTPSYRFTGLNDIKPEMLKEAAKNARIAAAEFAENTGSKVGKVKTARQGGFRIVDAGEEYGDTKKIEKDVRVVTTITFYLE